jgi:trehalose 6-phosphate synthase
MHLGAKEAALINERNGVLILSEGAGAVQQLGEWALVVAPADVEGTARALYEALTMPADERRRRAEAITAHVREHDVEAWGRGQMADLETIAEVASGR